MLWSKKKPEKITLSNAAGVFEESRGALWWFRVLAAAWTKNGVFLTF